MRSAVRKILVNDHFPILYQFAIRVPHRWNYYNRADVIFDPVEITCKTEQLWDFNTIHA